MSRAVWRPLAVLSSVLLLLVLGLVAAPLSTATGVAQRPKVAVDPASSTAIGITSISPAVLKPDTPVTLIGTVTNRGTTAIAVPVLHIAIVNDPLDTRSRVERWSNSPERFDRGTEVATAPLTGPVQPGASTTYNVTIPAAKLPYNYNLASLPTSLTVTEGADQTDESVRGSARTYLEWVGGQISKPVRVGWVVPLTLPADPALFGRPGAARNDAWRKAIGPGSAIDATITSLAGQPVTWLVDPSMLEPSAPSYGTVPPPAAPTPTPTPSTPSSTSSSSTSSTSSTTSERGAASTPGAPSSSTPSASSTGSSTGGSGGTGETPSSSSTSSSTSSSSTAPPEDETPSADPVADLALTLRDRLAASKAQQPVWFLPYSDPDFVALAAATGQTDVASALERELSPALKDIGTTVPLWAAGDLSRQSLLALTATWRTANSTVPTALLSSRQVYGDPRETTREAGQRLTDRTPVLTYDEILSFFAGTSGGNPGLRGQRFLAESMAIYQQRPSADRSVLVLAPRTGQATGSQIASIIATTRSAPWLATVAAPTLQREAQQATASTSVAARPAQPFTPQVGAPITAVNRAHINADLTLVDDLGDILVESDDLVQGWHQAYGELASTRWRGRAAAYADVLTTHSDAIRAIPKNIKVTPSSVNFFTDSGNITVTVVNELARPVHNLQLSLEPRRFQLRVDEQPRPVSLRADSRSSVRVPVTAQAAGQVPVDAILTTPRGTALGTPPDKPVQLNINVRPTGSWIYWVLGIVASLILVIGLLRSLRRGPRAETSMPLPTGVPEPDGAPEPSPKGDDD